MDLIQPFLSQVTKANLCTLLFFCFPLISFNIAVAKKHIHLRLFTLTLNAVSVHFSSAFISKSC